MGVEMDMIQTKKALSPTGLLMKKKKLFLTNPVTKA
jgi:hypothetical protein